MASNDLIIDDRYCKTVSDFCIEQGNILDQFADKYIQILKAVFESGITAGSTHDVLKLYISYAEKLKNQYSGFSDGAKKQIEAFVQKIDAADQYLF